MALRIAHAPTATRTQTTRLHLGCGDVHLPGFVNVDLLPLPGVDLQDDIRSLPSVADASVAQIYACHVLEHFSHDEVPEILTRWYQVLQPGGELRISVPDIDRIVQIYMANWQHFQVPGHSPWIGLLYGGQKDGFDFHKTGFNFCWLRWLLQQVGFAEIAEYPHAPHWLGPGVQDASLAHEPFGQYLSLNVRAIRPA